MLVKLYQQAIEYYSAMDDSLFNDVLQRQQLLLTRPEIVAMLYPEPNTSNQNGDDKENAEVVLSTDKAENVNMKPE
jgi:hypothetical protein